MWTKIVKFSIAWLWLSSLSLNKALNFSNQKAKLLCTIVANRVLLVNFDLQMWLFYLTSLIQAQYLEFSTGQFPNLGSQYVDYYVKEYQSLKKNITSWRHVPHGHIQSEVKAT